MRSAIIAAIATGLIIASVAYAAPDKWSNDRGIDFARAPIPKSGHTTQISVTSTSAGTSQLSEETVYSIICTLAVYWETGDSGAATADSNADYLPADTLLYFSTGHGDVTRYVSAIAQDGASSGTCFLHEQR